MDVGSPAAPASSCRSASSRGYTAACSSNACLDPFGAGQLNFFGDLAALADPAAFARHEPAAPPATDGDCAKRDGEAVATSSKSQAGNAPRAELTGLIDSKGVILAAAANGLPLEFFARVIWEESRFQLKAVGPTTSSGHRAQRDRAIHAIPPPSA